MEGMLAAKPGRRSFASTSRINPSVRAMIRIPRLRVLLTAGINI
jgi:hypothetical protein